MKNFIFSIVAVLVLCIGVFAIPKADLPTNPSASVSVAEATPTASAVTIDNLSQIPAIAVTATIEANASPICLAAFAKTENPTDRTATASRIHPSAAFAKDYSPPPVNGKQSSQALDRTDNDNVPLGSPKPVEATARNGSPAVSRASPTSR